MLDGIDCHAYGFSADSARWTSHGRPHRGLAGRSGDRQLCYNRGIVDFLGSRGYAMSVLRPQRLLNRKKRPAPGASGSFRTLWPMSASKDRNLVRRRWRFGKATLKVKVLLNRPGN
jgi:hypothetical protein